MEKQVILSLKQINQSLVSSINTLVDKKYKVTVSYFKKKTVVQVFGSKYEIYDMASYNLFKEIIKNTIK